MDIEHAREIVASQDYTDPVAALEAVAAVLRFGAITDQRLLGIAASIEAVAAELGSGGGAEPAGAGGGAACES